MTVEAEPKERCTNCVAGIQRCADGFVFTCGSCGGSGWVYGSAALMVRSIRKEMEEEEGEDDAR